MGETRPYRVKASLTKHPNWAKVVVVTEIETMVVELQLASVTDRL